MECGIIRLEDNIIHGRSELIMNDLQDYANELANLIIVKYADDLRELSEGQVVSAVNQVLTGLALEQEWNLNNGQLRKVRDMAVDLVMEAIKNNEV